MENAPGDYIYSICMPSVRQRTSEVGIVLPVSKAWNWEIWHTSMDAHREKLTHLMLSLRGNYAPKILFLFLFYFYCIFGVFFDLFIFDIVLYQLPEMTF